MAVIRIPQREITWTDDAQIAAFLSQYRIEFERWPLADRVAPSADPERILAAYAPEIDRLKKRGGYVTADLIDVMPDTAGLDELLARFNKEHRHADDEVRFVVQGRGVFHIHPPDTDVFSIEVQPGEFITVPAGTRHWFDLCTERRIRAIRLFRNPAGWKPEYERAGVHDDFTPLCWSQAGSNPAHGPRFAPRVTIA